MAWVLRIRSSDRDAELIAGLLWDHGPTAITETIIDTGVMLTAGFVGEAAAAEALEQLVAADGFDPPPSMPASIEIEQIDTDWSGPRASDVVVGDHLLRIESGQAFGHGAHPTTALALELLNRFVRPGHRVLDVGTGTGVLAIAAAKLGAGEVVAIDIDAAALEVALLNAAANGVDIDVTADAVGDVTGEFDVVVANLLAADLAPVADDVRRRCGTTGVLIVSGCLIAQQPWVEEMLGRPAVERRDHDGWLGLVFGPGRNP